MNQRYTQTNECFYFLKYSFALVGLVSSMAQPVQRSLPTFMRTFADQLHFVYIYIYIYCRNHLTPIEAVPGFHPYQQKRKKVAQVSM
ncbi:uncharacterized protein BYT42DRAFT_569444 [Radiomyces spectabilis]|uniref:uncharacterized protein n=1 Tax=Radiomyces spectabilis TaxID=64574 RepID=UPI00221EA2E7|nr:uncharacterized protein BYT42DRAFT_569444 [Radiomyces spectabilis]KAI8379628.1 hypothetical protein BYT42DRAFT_569444 [Radiomyces spectabilis]